VSNQREVQTGFLHTPTICNETKTWNMIFEYCTDKWFCEYVGGVVGSLDVGGFELAVFNMGSNEVKLDVNMFQVAVVHVVGGKGYCTIVVNFQWCHGFFCEPNLFEG
jgi:hypothetical protein